MLLWCFKPFSMPHYVLILPLLYITHTYTQYYRYIYLHMPFTYWTYRSVGSLEKKQLSPVPSGSFGILTAVLVGIEGGRVALSQKQNGKVQSASWKGRQELAVATWSIGKIWNHRRTWPTACLVFRLEVTDMWVQGQVGLRKKGQEAKLGQEA